MLVLLELGERGLEQAGQRLLRLSGASLRRDLAGGLGGVQLGADGGLAGGLAGLTDLANAQAAQMTQANMPHAGVVAQSADGATELERSTQPAGASVGGTVGVGAGAGLGDLASLIGGAGAVGTNGGLSGLLGGAGAVGVPGGGGGLSNGVTQGAIDPQVAAATIYASLRATPNGASLNAFTDDAVKREEGEPAREEEANGHGDGDTEVKAADAGEASGGDGERADEEQPRAAEPEAEAEPEPEPEAGAKPEAKRQRVAVDKAKQEPKPDEAAAPKTETPTRRTSPRMR